MIYLGFSAEMVSIDWHANQRHLCMLFSCVFMCSASGLVDIDVALRVYGPGFDSRSRRRVSFFVTSRRRLLDFFFFNSVSIPSIIVIPNLTDTNT